MAACDESGCDVCQYVDGQLTCEEPADQWNEGREYGPTEQGGNKKGRYELAGLHLGGMLFQYKDFVHSILKILLPQLGPTATIMIGGLDAWAEQDLST